MPAPTVPPELEKALRLLVHDLRAPLSVAHGYLRLVREHRLPDETERDRALAQSAEALGRISRLCDDALAYVALGDDAHARPLVATSADELVARLASALDGALPVIGRPLPATATLDLIDPPGLVEALATIALAAWQRLGRRRGTTVTASLTHSELQLAIGPEPASSSAIAESDTAVFDPWRGGHGLALPRACRLVVLARGDVRSAADGHVTIISLPVEMPA